MIQLSGAGKRFGHKLLFENADWLITPHDRIGLVGGNGTGKSTLMKVLAGMDTFDYGSAHHRQGHIRRISSAGRPHALRPHRLRRVHVGVRRPARDGDGTGIADPQHGGTRPHQPGIRGRRRPLSSRRARVPHARRLFDRSRSRTRADGPGLHQRRLAAPDRRILRRMADAPRARQASVCRSPTCCCSTSRPTISISKPATGWKNICRTIRMRSC